MSTTVDYHDIADRLRMMEELTVMHSQAQAEQPPTTWCYHRSHDVPVVFCELTRGHEGAHKSRAHEWDRDGTGYRNIE